MKKAFKTIIILSIFSIFSSISVLAGVNLPWESTFNCNEWQETEGSDWPPRCDELQIGLWGDFFETQITTSANYSGGGGGRGLRFWKYSSDKNDQSGIARIYFSSNQKEFWLRWYVRFESGFAWYNRLNYDKIIYLYYGTNTGLGGFEFKGNNTMTFWRSGIIYPSTNGGWTDQMGGSTSDGSWHYHEIHIKMDTDGTNGIGEYWLDGVQKISVNNINWSGKLNDPGRRFWRFHV